MSVGLKVTFNLFIFITDIYLYLKQHGLLKK